MSTLAAILLVLPLSGCGGDERDADKSAKPKTSIVMPASCEKTLDQADDLVKNSTDFVKSMKEMALGTGDVFEAAGKQDIDALTTAAGAIRSIGRDISDQSDVKAAILPDFTENIDTCTADGSALPNGQTVPAACTKAIAEAARLGAVTTELATDSSRLWDVNIEAIEASAVPDFDTLTALMGEWGDISKVIAGVHKDVTATPYEDDARECRQTAR